MKEIWILLGTGAVAGIASGLFGVGGGLIVIPILIIALGYTQHLAQGTSLVALLLPVGILGVFTYYQAGQVNIKAGLIIGAGLFAGAFLGAFFANILPEALMRRCFAVFLVGVGLYMFFRP